MIQVKNLINITFKIQQLVFIKHFNTVIFKLQLSNFNFKRTMCHQNFGQIVTKFVVPMSHRFKT